MSVAVNVQRSMGCRWTMWSVYVSGSTSADPKTWFELGLVMCYAVADSGRCCRIHPPSLCLRTCVIMSCLECWKLMLYFSRVQCTWHVTIFVAFWWLSVTTLVPRPVLRNTHQLIIYKFWPTSLPINKVTPCYSTSHIPPTSHVLCILFVLICLYPLYLWT